MVAGQYNLLAIQPPICGGWSELKNLTAVKAAKNKLTVNIKWAKSKMLMLKQASMLQS